MKKLLFIFFVLLSFSFAIPAQTIKTDEARKLKEVEKSIRYAESDLEYQKKQLKIFSSDVYSESQREPFRTQISKLETSLLKLYEERKVLITKPMTISLPNTQIELLKILILQNEKIIDLLEDKNK